MSHVDEPNPFQDCACMQVDCPHLDAAEECPNQAEEIVTLNKTATPMCGPCAKHARKEPAP
jgi:hypothetical protein